MSEPRPEYTAGKLQLLGAMSEREWQRQVLQWAKRGGWLAHHCRAARTNGGWSTPIEGDQGFPDLVLARGGYVILAELKAGRHQPSATQQQWRLAIGDQYRLWRPADWEEVERELCGRPRQTPILHVASGRIIGIDE